jgi:hypothetical protein
MHFVADASLGVISGHELRKIARKTLDDEDGYFDVNSNSSTCEDWLPTLPELTRTPLWVNCALYTGVFLLVATVIVTSCYLRTGVPVFRRQPLLSTLVVAFAVARFALSVLLIVLSVNHHGAKTTFTIQERRIASLLDGLGTIFFFASTGLLIADLADMLLVGWKSSRRLWVAFKGLTVLLTLTAGISVWLTRSLELEQLLEISEDAVAAASVCSALAIAALALRSYRMHEHSAILSRFGHVRHAMNVLVGFVVFCFLFRAVPWRLMMNTIAALHLCPTIPDGGYLPWLAFIQKLWLSEIGPAGALLLFGCYLDRLKCAPPPRAATTRCDRPWLLISS